MTFGDFEKKDRKRKREKEIEIVLDKIAPLFQPEGDRRILEFGSGDGYQIPYLRKLGNVIASDIYQSENIQKHCPDIDFVICNIKNAPFVSGSFDLVFANHVLEHIDNISDAFAELKRVGSNDCIYAFAVPTSLWLLLSVPAQFRNGLLKLYNRLLRRKISKPKGHSGAGIKGWRAFLPRGHGWRKNFFDCFNSFKMKNWHSLFYENGFKIVKVAPLLLYAPSELPIVPTTRFLVNQGIYSSAIFITRKVNEAQTYRTK